MLYGMEMINNEWKLRSYRTTESLVFSRDSRMYPKIPAHYFKERLELFGANGEYFYYVFSFQEKPRFIFVAKESINFASIDLPENRQDGKIALVVEGALYDIRTERFITFDSNEIFFRYVLYDAGIPHVIYDEEQGSYSFFTLSSKGAFKARYKKVFNYEDPQFISYVYKDSDTMELNCTRVIFYKDTNGKDNMLVLSDEIVCKISAKDVTFKEIVPTVDAEFSDNEYYKAAYNNENVAYSLLNEYGFFDNFHLASGDAIIVNVSEGDWKEHAFLRLDNGDIEFNPKETFFSYKKVDSRSEALSGHNLVKIIWRKNDFDNETEVVDFTSNRIYSINEFEMVTTSA